MVEIAVEGGLLHGVVVVVGAIVEIVVGLVDLVAAVELEAEADHAALLVVIIKIDALEDRIGKIAAMAMEMARIKLKI
jgi:hypothetical protein